MRLTKHIPNILTLMRVPLAFLFVFAYFRQAASDSRILALGVFTLSSLTDILDGFLARRLGCISSFGKLADPFADKLTQCTVLVCLSADNVVPIWLTAVYLIKEITLVVSSVLLVRKGNTVVCSNVFGKASTVLFYVVISSALAFTRFARTSTVFLVLCIIMTLSSEIAMLSYFLKYKNQLSRMVSKTDK